MKLTLKDTSLLEPRARIGDKWVAGKKQFPVINPATGEQIGEAANGSSEQAQQAIAKMTTEKMNASVRSSCIDTRRGREITISPGSERLFI